MQRWRTGMRGGNSDLRWSEGGDRSKVAIAVWRFDCDLLSDARQRTPTDSGRISLGRAGAMNADYMTQELSSWVTNGFTSVASCHAHQVHLANRRGAALTAPNRFLESWRIRTMVRRCLTGGVSRGQRLHSLHTTETVFTQSRTISAASDGRVLGASAELQDKMHLMML